MNDENMMKKQMDKKGRRTLEAMLSESSVLWPPGGHNYLGAGGVGKGLGVGKEKII